MVIFERALEDLINHVKGDYVQTGEEREDEEGALDGEESDKHRALIRFLKGDEGERPEWSRNPRERLAKWDMLKDALHKKGASDEDLEALKPKWEESFGKLPKTAIEGHYGFSGGQMGSDRAARRARRQAAFDKRWPEATRLDPQSALEVSYGEAQPFVRREPLSKGTVERWGDVLERIKHV